MSVDTKHDEYKAAAPLWDKMRDTDAGPEQVKAKGEAYLPKYGGMSAERDPTGKRYNAYKTRAQFPDIVSSAVSGIVGLLFQSAPEGADDEIVTNSGGTKTEFAREAVRGVSTVGKDIIVVDAPLTEEGGTPFLAPYAAESMINWKLDPKNPARFTMVVFKEKVPNPKNIYSHETKTQFRRYLINDAGKVELTLWEKSDANEKVDVKTFEKVLAITEIPVFTPGSLDAKPSTDRAPLMPIANAALSYYRKSASYESALHLLGEPTPWVKGVDSETYKKIADMGVGAAALWDLGPEGSAGFLSAMVDPMAIERGMENELKMAERFAIKLANDEGQAESGRALAIRAATQHASIFSIADSVSTAINDALKFRAKWGGLLEPEKFGISTDFTASQASDHLIAGLSQAIISRTAPPSAMYSAIRQSGLSDKTDAEMAEEIANQPAPGFEFDDE